VIELSIRLEWYPCEPSFGKRRIGVCGYQFFLDRLLLNDSDSESRLEYVDSSLKSYEKLAGYTRG
jgi:hypothetical protein